MCVCVCVTNSYIFHVLTYNFHSLSIFSFCFLFLHKKLLSTDSFFSFFILFNVLFSFPFFLFPYK